jgi:hypothetical protein
MKKEDMPCIMNLYLKQFLLMLVTVHNETRGRPMVVALTEAIQSYLSTGEVKWLLLAMISASAELLLFSHKLTYWRNRYDRVHRIKVSVCFVGTYNHKL